MGPEYFNKRSDLFQFSSHTRHSGAAAATFRAQTFARFKLNYLCPPRAPANKMYIFLSLEFNIFHFNVFYESLLLKSRALF